MACSKCEGKGFVETYYGAANSFTPSINQCPLRCDIGAYSREVQKRLSKPKTEREVLPHSTATKCAKVVDIFHKRDQGE